MSILIRLILASSLLAMTTSTAVSFAAPSDDSYPTSLPATMRQQEPPDHPGGDGIRPAPVVPESQPAGYPQHAAKPAEVTPSMQPQVLGPNAPIQGPVDLKLLVISADGQESDFAAITAFLNQVGVPYDVITATQTSLVPSMLWDGVSHGYYQGILLCTGNLTYFNGTTWVTAFDNTEWQTLWEYERLFGARQVTLFTYPDGFPENYGLNLVPSQTTFTMTLQAQLTTAGQQVFSYLKPTTPITIANSYTYSATVVPPSASQVTTPLLTTAGGYTIAAVTTYANGRENLAVTTANSPSLLHSMLLSYGIINWVTNGLFLGERHVNLDVQVDDLLLDGDIWDTVNLTDTTGISYRLSGSDFNLVTAWQNGVRSSPNTSNFRLEWPFNGEGATGIYNPDTLTPAVIAGQGQHNFVNHTYDHPYLDEIAYNAAYFELDTNDSVARDILHLTNYYSDTMVQPDITGLTNTLFLQAAHDFGIRYLIADTSRPGWNNPSPNAGFYSIYQPDILIIPRRPTNLFYNLSTPAEWVSEYNCYYGPITTTSCLGGAWSFWDHNLSYAEILNAESDVWLSYLLKWDLDPLMFHNSNTRAYSNTTQSLLGDLLDATLAKYNSHYNLPIRNLSEHGVGINMANRMAYNASGAHASIVPCTQMTLTTTSPALIPVTGFAYGANQEVYGGQNISYIQMGTNQTLVLPAPPPCQKINFGSLPNKTYGDLPFVITATATSWLTATFAADGPCLVGTSTLSGTTSLATATITGAGTCTITATQPGNQIAGKTYYNAATPVTQTFTIAKANQAISFGALTDKIYGDPLFPITATASSNLTATFTALGPCLVSGSSLSGSSSTATVTIMGAGSCSIGSSQSGNANYNAATPVTQTFTITKANQAISFGALTDKIYGDPPFPITATASSNLTATFTALGPCLVSGSSLSGSSSTAIVTITGTGSCSIGSSQSGNVNYNAATPVTQTFTIAKANQAITFGSLANKVYGNPPFVISATASSNLTATFTALGPCLVSGSSLSGSVSTATVTIMGAGSCSIGSSQSGNANFNAATPVTQTFTIAKANQSITFGPLANKGFLSTPFVISATASSNLTVTFTATGPCLVGTSTFNGITSSATITLTGSGGSCAITASQLGDANNNAAAAVLRTFTIMRYDVFLPFVSRGSTTSH